MKRHSVLHKGIWLIAMVAVIALHGTLLYYVTSHIALSALLVACLAILLVLKVSIVKRAPHSVRNSPGTPPQGIRDTTHKTRLEEDI
jgi:hypothetical protein